MSEIPVTPEEDEAMDELARRQDGDVGLDRDDGMGTSGRSGGDVAGLAASQGPEAAGAADRAPRPTAPTSLAEALYNAWDEVRVRRFHAWMVSGASRDKDGLRRLSVGVFEELIERGVITVNVKEAAHAAH